QLIAYDEPINGKRAREDKENVSMITKSNKRPVLTNRNYLGKVDSNQTNENKHLYEYCNYIKAKKQKSSLFGFLVYSAYLSQISFKEDEEHTLSTAYMEKLGNEKENEHVQVRIFWNLFRDAMIDHKYTTFILYLDKFIQEWGWDELKEEVMFDKKLIKAFSSISSLQYNADLPDVVRIISKTIKLDLLVKNDVLLSGIIDTSSLHLDIVTELKLANKWEEVNEKPINEALPNGILEFIYEYIQREEKHQIPVEFMNSIIEFYIIDQKYLPLHRSRLINRLKIPYNDLDNETFYKSIVDVMKTLFYIKNIMKKNLETIKKIEKLSFKLSSDLGKTVNILKTYDSD
ncbi:6975_t:CDS:2, partial [Entrophospora sp. SA101]